MDDNNHNRELEAFFGKPISVYTRAQALADGVLIDLLARPEQEVRAICQQLFKHPVHCTAAVWALIEKAVASEAHGNDVAGVLYDILYMSIAHFEALDPQTRRFKVIVTGTSETPCERYPTHEFKLVCGPNDDHSPVLTLMLGWED